MIAIIAGPRDYTNKAQAFQLLDIVFSVTKPDKVLSGGATGMDEIGELWAIENGIPVEVHKADWNKYGKSAGPKRNEAMAKIATHCVVIWQGKSRGSKNMIETAKRYNLVLREALVP